MRHLLIGAALAAALLLIPAAAEAQTACNSRDAVLSQLAERYDETPVALGVTSTGGLLEALAADDGGSWTIIVTSPAGMSCLVAAGEGWRMIGPAPGAGEPRIEADPALAPRRTSAAAAPVPAHGTTTIIIRCPDTKPTGRPRIPRIKSRAGAGPRPRACSGPRYPCPNP